MDCLVTGGAGFIGHNLVRFLLDEGHHVRVLDNFSTGKRENLGPFLSKIELIEGDLRSYHTVHEATQDIEVIFHQGALPSVPRSINDPITTNQVCVEGTLNILDSAKTQNRSMQPSCRYSSPHSLMAAVSRSTVTGSNPATLLSWRT